MDPHAPQPEQQQPTVPAQTAEPAPQPAPPAPLYQTTAWHMPDGNFSVFGFRECVLTVYPGMVVVHRKSDHAEVRRIQLTPDLKMKYFMNYARIAQMNGQKFSVWSQKGLFLMVTPWSYGGLLAGIFLNSFYGIATATTYPDPTQVLFVRIVALALIFGGLAWMAMGIPKAKVLIAACKRAAGSAQ